MIIAFSQSAFAMTPELIVSDSSITNFEISDTIKTTSIEEINAYYKKRLTRINNRWKRLMPHYTKLQFAGGMGILSIGMGLWQTPTMGDRSIFWISPKVLNQRGKTDNDH